MAIENFDRQKLANLLTQIFQQDVSKENISHKLILVTILITSLLGVIYADDQVEESEKQHLKSILDEFIPAKSRLNKLIKPIVSGILKSKIYLRKDAISILSKGLKPSEKILIIGLCYQMANADGEVAEQEKGYIKNISNLFEIDAKYLSFLSGESGFKEVNSEIIFEIKNLLDPHHFQHLDPTFARAADLLRNKLIFKHEQINKESGLKISYNQLGNFKRLRDDLLKITIKVSDLIKEAVDQDVLPSILENEAIQLLEKVKSQNFRLAIIGEFSQGKSTLLNALMGEEIQPTRAIPCSGEVTVLKYGERQRVICRFKDGHEEEVPLENYKELASISEDAALSSIAEELSTSLIHEIIFEHPQLELCRNHVEVIDSPGLNEHPNRTAITHQLLENTDAVIFLANASRLLTQSEQTLLLSLKEKLQGSNVLEKPVENLFVIVNFMDLARSEKDKEQVKQRANNFFYGKTPLIVEKGRLHFISAQSALDAILEGKKDDEYLENFKNFVKSIEIFLTQERGSLVIRQNKEKLHQLIKETRTNLKQSINILDGQVQLSESDKTQIIEQIGITSGWDVKLRILCDELVNDSLEYIGNSWEEWLQSIEENISEKSAHWTSDADDNENILKDFANQFSDDLSSEFKYWVEEEVKKATLVPAINQFDKMASAAIDSIYENLKSIDLSSGSNLSEQFNLSLANFGVDLRFNSDLNSSFLQNEDDDNFLGNTLNWVGGIGGIFAILGGGIVLSLLGGLAVGLSAGKLIGWFFGDDSDNVVVKMKQEVYNKGFEKFFDSIEQISEKIGEGSARAIRTRYENAIDAIENAISILNEILEKQEQIHKETKESSNARKEFIQQKISSLDGLSQLLDQ